MSSENKTQPTSSSYLEYLANIENKEHKVDAEKLAQIINKVAGVSPVMWGTSIVGFGEKHYKYVSGREGDTFVVGFSARKVALTIYGLLHDENSFTLVDKLGKHTQGKGCIYIKRLDEIDLSILEQLIKLSFKVDNS